MKILRKLIFFPAFVMVSLMNLSAAFIKKAVTMISGVYFLLMIAGILISLCSKAWSQLIIFAGLAASGYIILFLIVAIKIFIEELKEFCFRQLRGESYRG